MKNENEYVNRIPLSNMFKRAIWNIIYVLLFRPFPTKIFRSWRNFILRLFGAKVHRRAGVYCSAFITEPWNLILDNNAWIGPHALCDSTDVIHICNNATVSQYAYLCTASHDTSLKSFDLVTKPITIKENAWVAAGSFVGMGVTIGEGAVVGARSSVFKDVDSWSIVGGCPAKFIKKRIME